MQISPSPPPLSSLPLFSEKTFFSSAFSPWIDADLFSSGADNFLSPVGDSSLLRVPLPSPPGRWRLGRRRRRRFSSPLRSSDGSRIGNVSEEGEEEEETRGKTEGEWLIERELAKKGEETIEGGGIAKAKPIGKGPKRLSAVVGESVRVADAR